MNSHQLILVTGGVRSGKSRLAEAMALAIGGPAAYIATSRIEDEEMLERVSRHQERRPADWVTIDAPWDLAEALRKLPAGTRTVIIDCLGVFVSNLLLKYAGSNDPTQLEVEKQVLDTVSSFLQAQAAASVTTIVVTNETGLGVVPPSALGRAFRDYLGWANQMVAAAADRVYLVVAGIPLLIKNGQESALPLV
ncbi:MAG: bifunctional adenosylcobinamide kinase/adenosylcobinamide-phosphate guanylyltransferase [Firmicutes bacterium]|nr:bifunctional adenosylcobinamide kinase/adenosylcobinamide-phosphate guanylyltransferase [Bacillota bacterium]